MKFTNLCFVWTPKYISPLNDGKTYLIVSKDKSIPKNGKSYVIVTNSPKYNGLYGVPEELFSRAKTYINNRRPCWLLDIDELKKICNLEEIKNDEIQACIKQEQDAYKQYKLMKRLTQ